MLWLTIAIVLSTELLIFAPGLSWDRRIWLSKRSLEATIAMQSLAGAPQGSLNADARDGLLRSSGTLGIRLLGPAGPRLNLEPEWPLPAADPVDLRKEDAFSGMLRSFATLIGGRERYLLIVDRTPFLVWDEIQFEIPAAQLTAELRQFAGAYAWLSLLIVALSTVIAYLALRLLLVLPLRRITRSIVAFRADPKGTAPLDLGAVGIVADEEIALAGHELAAMQRSLREALWRNARLVDVGLAVVKFGHDMRNVLSPGLMAAERLASHGDAGIARSGASALRAIDRASELVDQTLAFVRDGRAVSSLSRFRLAGLIDEVAQAVLASARSRMENRVVRELEVVAGQDDLFRVLANLVRNSTEAGANLIRVQCSETQELLTIDVTDDGPGLPDQVLARLFQPFARSDKPGSNGLGLVIARDLMRAQGGDLALQSTSPTGTVFRLTLSLTLRSLGEVLSEAPVAVEPAT